MNLVLLTETDLLPDGTARVTGRRLDHVREVLKGTVGSALRVGLLNGSMGSGEVLVSTSDELLLRVELNRAPPPRPAIDLILALPRPKALKKLLPAAAALGVDRLVLVNAARVEKSYFTSQWLAPEQLQALMCLGLEQACDTVPPQVIVRERFRPFVEDELDALLGQGTRLVAHPTAPTGLPSPSELGQPGRVCLAIGPEGGWVPFELDLLALHGFFPFTFGPRILRVEVAVPYALGALATRYAGTPL